ncbi:autotransporter domain-containing protein [Pusillimonas noertemannii]|uniref:autotransporter domain-containing protein n=1 Tax=Pusillimonas noertemannii TaxID=305977 RepID=UPI00140274A8|nr:autotransporter domain-containing protein [Pusillimonas noertemannii]NYT69405.1 autotransporter domain-containing protein [Pusillimonas noertemannii]
MTTDSLTIGNGTNNSSVPNITQETGVVTVDGNTAELIASHLTVGHYGAGTLNIVNGGSAIANANVTLGTFGDDISDNSHGTLNVTGHSSSFSSHGLNIGSSGEGTFLLSDGAAATTGSTSIGLSGRAIGQATVEGEGTSWQVTSNHVTVGQSGMGTLEVADGAVVTIEQGALRIGWNATGVGHVEIKGAGSQVSSLGTTNTDYMAIGYSGEGTLALSEGGSADASTTILGVNNTGIGTLTLDGAGTVARSNNYTMVGYYGTGTATVSNGATLRDEAAGGVRIAYAAGSTGTLNIGAAADQAATGAGNIITTRGIVFGDGTGKLVLNHTATDYTLAPGISGHGTVDVLAGTTVLAGDSSGFTGTVNLHGGALGLTGKLGAADLNVDNALLSVTAGGQLETNGMRIGHQGQGAVIVREGSALSVANQLKIAADAGSQGTLVIGAQAGEAAAAAGSVQAGNGVAMGAGDARLVFNHSNSDYVFAPGISGTGSIEFLAGNTTLQGDSSGFSGNTAIQAGTVLLTGALGGTVQIEADGLLQVGNDASNGSLTGNAVNNGTLVFDQVGDYDYTGALSGSGGIVKRGNGVLKLSGDYHYQGSTVVQGGAISLAAQLDPRTDLLIEGGVFDLSGKTQTVAGLSGGGGELALGETGNLTVNQNNDSSFGGSLSGAGTFNKNGPATLNLTGVSTFSGQVNVHGGRLTLNGRLPGAVFVQNSATLGGSGMAGSIIARQGGTVAPGNSIGTLRVNHDVQFDAGSVYAIEVDAAGNSDKILATGRALLNGGTVQVLAEAGDYKPYTSYLILDAGGGVSGRFENATSNFAFLSPSLAYAPNTVTLALTRNDVAFSQMAETPNQRATAEAINSAFAVGSPVYQALVTSTAEGARQAFDALSGEVHASTLSAAAQQSETLRRTALDRLDVHAEGTQLWVQANGALADLRGNDNSAKVSVRDAGGLSLGVDTDLGPLRVGVAASYATSDVSVRERNSNADIKALSASIYAGARVGALALRAGAGYSDLDFKTSRNVAVSSLSDHLSAKYGGKATTLFGEVGYPLHLAAGQVVEPFVGVNALWLKNDAFDESGGSLALRGERRSRNYAWSTLGVKGSFVLGQAKPVVVSAKLGWQHALSKRDVESTLAFAQGGAAYAIQGAPLAKDAALLDLNLDWRLSPATQFGIGYSGSLANQGSSHTARAVLRTLF